MTQPTFIDTPYPPAPLEPTRTGSGGGPRPVFELPPPYRTRYRLAAVLFVLTFFTTTTLGALLYLFTRTDEMTSFEFLFIGPSAVREVWTSPRLLGHGLSFSIPLLLILGSHELGHFFACRRYRVPSTAPYFLPAPFGIGTFGAVIRIRARIATKAQLFDIGIAGPIAGFLVLLPFLVVGVAWSRPAMVAVAQDLSRVESELYLPGTNLAIWLLTLAFHGRLPANALLELHPFALAAWVGLIATALNLLPMGQLDGGHVLYAVAGHLHRPVAWLTWLAVCALGIFVSWGWLIICLVVLVVMGIGHPPVLDDVQPLDPRRRRLALAALVLLVLSFTPVPIDRLFLEPIPGVLVERRSEVEQEGHRPVVDQRHLHPRAEPPGRNL